MSRREEPSESASRFSFGKGKQTEELARMRQTLDDLTNERDMWKYEADKERNKKETQEEKNRYLQRQIVEKDNEMQRLKSKNSSLDSERELALANEGDLQRRLQHLDDKCHKKDDELKTYGQKVAATASALSNRDNQIAQKTAELRRKDDELLQAKKEIQQHQDTISRLRNQAEEDNGRIHRQDTDMHSRLEKLQNELDESRKTVTSLSGKIQALCLELQEGKYRNEDLKKQIEGKEAREHQLKHDAMRLTEDKARLTKEVDDMAKRLEEGKEERETMSRKGTEDLTRTKVMEQKVRDYSEKIEKLEQENQRVKDENLRLKEEKCILEAQDNSSKRECGDVREDMAALKAASETRERMLQKEIESLQHQRLQDMREQEERHRSEKEEMQSQIQTFLQTLNDQKHVERDAIRAAIQQMGQTNAITNQMLQAAFRTYHRQHYTPANIRELDEDP